MQIKFANNLFPGLITDHTDLLYFPLLIAKVLQWWFVIITNENYVYKWWEGNKTTKITLQKQRCVFVGHNSGVVCNPGLILTLNWQKVLRSQANQQYIYHCSQISQCSFLSEYSPSNTLLTNIPSEDVTSLRAVFAITDSLNASILEGKDDVPGHNVLKWKQWIILRTSLKFSCMAEYLK